MENIYHIQDRFESTVNRIKNSESISEHNKELILKFNDECFALGLSIYRVLFYMNRFYKIGGWVEKDFDKMSEADLKHLVQKIWQMEYAYRTKMDYNVSIKRFYKWLEGNGRTYPEKVSWISTTEKKASRRLPEDILTREDILELIKAATHIRDKAFVSAIYESGCRISEILNLKLKHVEFDTYGAILRVYGKTGSRRVRLISATPHLSNWVQHHPLSGDPESPLWVSIGTTHNKRKLVYSSISTLLRRIAKRAGVKKRVSPHSFRHARATHLASKLTEAQMKEFFGWVQGSEMASIYVHMSGRDVDNAILKLYGKLPKQEEEANKEMEIRTCPRCTFDNAPENELCGRCSLPLTTKRAMEAKEQEEEFINNVVPRESIDQMIEKKVEEILSQKT